MSEVKKYMDIPRLGHKTTLDYFSEIASKNKQIRVELKYDGSNGQFEVNENNELLVYSRKTLLNEEENLRGFYQYVHNLVDPTVLPKGYKIFGEWLVSHSVQYPAQMYNHFYLFNVYDSNKQEYISPDSDVYKHIESYLLSIGMKTAKVLYEGEYKGIEHIQDILKKVTKDDEEYKGGKPESEDDVFHEGIVVKSYNYRNRSGDQLFVKLVGERFKEIKKVKHKEKVKGPDNSVESKIAHFAVTRARVEKMINKLVDEGILPEDFDLEHMSTIAKNIPRRVYEDIMKEELDTIQDEFGEFDEKVIGKKINSVTMNLSKEIVKSRIEERLSNLQ